MTVTGDVSTAFLRPVVVRTSANVVLGRVLVSLGSASLSESAGWEGGEGGSDIGQGVGVTREMASEDGDSGKGEADMKVPFWEIW